MTKEVDDILRQFNNKVTLSEFIGKYIKVIPRGNNHIAICPFHNEKTPSFSINNEKGLFYCFGCGAGGNVFNFLSKYKGMSFYESLKYVANYLGIELKNNLNPRNQFRDNSVFEILKYANQFFTKKINVNREVLDYLKKRSINQDLINQFNIGYCDSNDDQLIKFLVDKGFSEDKINVSGLLVKSKNNQSYFNRFKERILFPIFDFSENIVGFGGRTFNNSKIKYINSPESIFFKKSDNLFGFKQNLDSIKSSKEMIIVEGYLDVISLNSKKILNAVATLGTSLSENQITKIWNYSDNPILCFDGDSAGINSMKKIAIKILKFLKPGKSLKFIKIPNNMDPDNFVSLYGKEDFIDLKNKATTLSNFIWEIILGECEVKTPENLALIDEKIKKISNQITHKNISLEYLRFLKSKKNDFFWKNRISNINHTRSTNNKMVFGKQNNELILISFLINFSEYINEFIEEISNIKFENKDLDIKRKVILKAFIKNKKDNTLNNSLNLNELFSHEFIEETKRVKNNHFNFLELDKRRLFLRDLMNNIRLPYLLKECQEVKELILSTNEKNQKDLIKNYQKIIKEINFIKKKEI